MRVIIAGSRGIVMSPAQISAVVAASGFDISEVVCGLARGADRSGERWARNRQIPVKRFPADWAKHGKRAGILRNEQMATYADALIAIWDGVSPGTRHMISAAAAHGLRAYVVRVP